MTKQRTAEGNLVSAAVLAGGQSRRMGQDKRWVEVDGIPLLVRAVDAVRTVAHSIVVVGGRDGELDHPRLSQVLQVTDLRAEIGPVAGIETALATAMHPLVLVVPVDHPWLNVAVLQRLVDGLHHTDADAVLLESSEGPQLLIGAYRRSALALIRSYLDAGHRKTRRLLDIIDAELVPLSEWRALDPDLLTQADVDTPADLLAIDRPVAEGGQAELTRTSRRVPIIKVDSGSAQPREDRVVAEEPLVIRLAGPDQQPHEVATTMRTPGHEADLAIGWLFSEGLVQPGTIVDTHFGDPIALARPDDEITVLVDSEVALETIAHRHSVATASCGVCGRASIDELTMRCRPLGIAADVPAVAWSALADMPEQLRDEQATFSATGGLHATGIFTTAGTLVTLREDVGRHNALDAAIGAHVAAGDVPMTRYVAVLSGRIGFELVAKAATAQIPVIAAVGAPTDLAVRTAQQFGITLVGFLRDGRGNIYTHPERINLQG